MAQGSLGFRAIHRTEKRSFSLEGSTFITSDQEKEGTQRSDLGFTMTRFRPSRWFNAYLIGFESNDELGLDLRSSIGAGFGRYLIQTNISELALLGGLVGTAESLREDASSPTSPTSQENIEGLVGLSYYNSYDSDPPSSSNSTSDYGVITSIGYSF